MKTGVHFRAGLEPTTYRTWADSLPIEITGRFSYTVRESNPRPAVCKTAARSAELTVRNVVNTRPVTIVVHTPEGNASEVQFLAIVTAFPAINGDTAT